MALKISGSSIDNCLQKACTQYGWKRENIKYKVTKNEKHFFKRIVEIEIEDRPKVIIEENIPETSEKEEIKEKRPAEFPKNKNNHGAKVENGKIIVSDFDDDTTLITVEPCENVILFVNGSQSNFATPVSSTDEITYEFVEDEAVRDVKIGITTDKLEAYVTINYSPQNEYELVDCDFTQKLKLETRKIGQKMPPTYTERELIDLLDEKGVRYGILEDEIRAICKEDSVTERLVAKGIPCVNDIPDQIKLYFSDTNELIDYDNNDNKVDYRNRYLISNVKVGDVVAELIPGKDGRDGQSVLGMPIKRKAAKKLVLRAGENCVFRDNKVIASIEGKPAIKGSTVSINKVYTCSEVNLKSGNINFVGNVEIAKNVGEGMEVIAGQDLSVGKNVESANLQAGGQVIIEGNVITSTIKSGADRVSIKRHKDNLELYEKCIKQIIQMADRLKENAMFDSSRYGEIIKILIENKFKNIPGLSKDILRYNEKHDKKGSSISNFINSRMMGLGPVKIENVNELEKFLKNLEEEIMELEELASDSADIYVSYVQGSSIESAGNVIITGKGQYTSNIIALKNIEFIGNEAVCRGGTLVSGNEIKLKTVGSMAGVNTILKVPKEGRISAEIAYNNTLFCFGEKQTLLEVSSKDVNAFLDERGEIVIEKFVL